MNKIALHGVPRSGTSWLGAIFDSSPGVIYRNQPIFSYAFKSYLTSMSNKDRIDSFFNLISESEDEYILQTDGKQKGFIPDFKKHRISHIVYKETRYHDILANMMKQHNKIKVVGIVRNPKSVISSWYEAPKEFNKNEWDILTEWEDANLKNLGRQEEYYGYKKWKEVTNTFLNLEKLYPKRFYLLDYKDLLYNTEDTVQDLFNFCDINFSEQTIRFLAKSKNVDLSDNHYSVFRSNQVDNKWKINLPIEIITQINIDLEKSKLERFIYD